LFQRDNSARRDVVKKFQPALALQGNAERGHSIYQQRCAACHRAGGEGSAVGPDLASVAANGKEKILASVLDPNAEVAAAYLAYSVETRGGESFVGVLGGENPLAIMLKMANGETIRLGRENISALRATDTSLMPEGLEENLSEQDMADLLEFIVHAKPGS
jgi:putative heme-binding domain-containing protein